MNVMAREYLVRIVEHFGRGIADDPSRLRGLLADCCGKLKKEVNVLVAAAFERVPDTLIRTEGSEPPATVFARLVLQMQDDLGYSQHASKWAVKTWAIALHVRLPESEKDRVVCPTCAAPYRVHVPKPRQKFFCKRCSTTFRYNENEPSSVLTINQIGEFLRPPVHEASSSQLTMSNRNRNVETQVVGQKGCPHDQYR